MGKESIVIECQADGMHVYDDGLDVLTNQPPFPWHTENVRNYMHIETRIRAGCVDARHPARVRQRRGHDRVPGRLRPGQPLRAGRLPERALPRRRRRPPT